ncbi:MAG: DUF4249 domain-containing protein [Janthinobacterium lividum]
MQNNRGLFRRSSVAAGLLLSVGLSGCVDPYLPDVVGTNANYLVVDGFINGNGVTRIKLSRTINVATATAPPAEKGAKIFIVDNTGQRYALTEKASGSYQSDSMVLNSTRQYQLRITPAVGAAVYESSLVPLKVTPPIDNVKWKLDGNDIQFSLSTHDAQLQSRYYRWSFIETWQFNSAFESRLEYDTKRERIMPRKVPIYTCWRTERPSTIKQSSTAQLSQDVLVDFPILGASSRSERFTVRYSLLVSQYAETAAEFAYYDLLRKNTEAVGTVNDPLPTQLTGNVHRLDKPDEPVLGYVGAHTVQQRRLFINRADIPYPFGWRFDTPYQACDSLGKELRGDYKPPLPPGKSYIFQVPSNTPVGAIVSSSGNDTIGYTGASTECVDCRLHGTLTKPSYW